MNNDSPHPKPKQPSKQSRKPRILLGITGSVAAVKCPELAYILSHHDSIKANVCIVLTSGGKNFWNKAKEYNFQIWNQFCDEVIPFDIHHSLCNDWDGEDNGKMFVVENKDEWNNWNKVGDPVLHIQLRDWADIAILAPLSAHTLAKISNGLCDDLLSCCLRAWDFNSKAVVVAPAMNTKMWEHPLTGTQLQTLRSFSELVFVVEPQVKTLACGEVGVGAMADLQSILEVLNNKI